MISIIFGLLAIGLGLWGATAWHHELLFVFKGLFPLSLVLAGCVAVVMGIASRSTSRRPSSKEPKNTG